MDGKCRGISFDMDRIGRGISVYMDGKGRRISFDMDRERYGNIHVYG